LAACACPAMIPVAAAQSDDLNLKPVAASPSRPRASGDRPFGVLGDAPQADPYGLARGGAFISPTKFTLPLSAGAPPLTYNTFHYYRSPGSASPTGYFAQLDVPNGALVDLVTCMYNDSSVTNNVFGALQYYTTDFSGASATQTSSSLGSFTSSGTPGITFSYINFAPFTAHIFDDSTFVTQQYYLRIDIANDTSFGGCYAFYKRQTSPAPAVASFTDVPVGSPFFAEVEALKASGITSGCTATTYCPTATLTRLQMAIFLSRALGLNFPY